MMWFLLLAVPAAIVVVMGSVVRAGKVTATDTACAVTDLRLDRQADLIRGGAVAQPWVPKQRKALRVAPRPMVNLGSELLAG